MKILSIETSCDDTGISIIEAKGGIQDANFKVLVNTTHSQISVHMPYGGVFPALAKREHTINLPLLLEVCLKKTKLTKKEKPVDAIAVTYGPGLEIALWTGIVFAKELAKKWNVPLIPVNHMEGHLFSPFGKVKGTFKIPKIKNPTLSLLVSGGHTQLILIKKWMQYEIIGETLDDAVGEAFDKTARMLDLPYPGGPEISRLAEVAREKGEQASEGVRSATGARFQQFSNKKIAYPEKLSSPFSLPRPMIYTKNFNFSYSGLKTAVLYLVRDLKKENPKILEDEKIKQAIALEFENAAIECLTYKTNKAIEKYKIRSLIVAGGVSANKHLQNEMKKISKKTKVALFFPPRELTGDNSIMIGMAGYLNFIKNKNLPASRQGKVPKIESIKATGNLRL